MKLVVSSILMLCPRQLPPSAEEATNFHLKFVAYQRRSKQWQTKSYLLSQTKIVNEPGDSAKNLGPPFSSLESPATTPRFWRHFPISTSSAPPTSWRQRVPETSEGVISAQESSCCVFIKVALPASFFFIFVFLTVISKHVNSTGFEPRTSGIGSDPSANWATTTVFLTYQKLWMATIH